MLKWALAALAALAIVFVLLNGVLLERLPTADDRPGHLEFSGTELSDGHRRPETRPFARPSPASRPAPASEPILPAATRGADKIDDRLPDDGGDANELYPLLASAIESDFPELELTDAEIRQLSQAAAAIRQSLHGLRDAERAGGNIALIRQLEEQRDRALWDFERITGVSLGEFMRRAPSEGGLDNHAPVEEEITYEYLRDFNP